jgi:MinD superfamily P-loop ATPase
MSNAPSPGLRVAVASGKGGTGKTLISTNLARTLADDGRDTSYVDCDVEAPNGHLFLVPTQIVPSPVAVPVAQIDEDACTGCPTCSRICQYSAILSLPTHSVVLDDLCSGCGACVQACPTGAISERNVPVGVVEQAVSGSLTVRGGRMDIGRTAEHEIVRSVLHASREQDTGWVVMDSPPGVACTAAETVRNADVALLVTEPTPAGLHDLALAVELARELEVPCAVALNRAGEDDAGVREYCAERGIPILLELLDDRGIAEIYARGDLLVEVDPTHRERFRRLATDLQAMTSAGTAVTSAGAAGPAPRNGPPPGTVADPGAGTSTGATPPVPSSMHSTDPLRTDLVVLSGKGGTGKTSLSAALTRLAAADTAQVIVDADVDAANFALLTEAVPTASWPFVGGKHAVVDPAVCTGCGICVEHCRFDALTLRDATSPEALGEFVAVVDTAACEGCTLCEHLCPDLAIRMEPTTGGSWSLAETPAGPLVHARLTPGQQNSGKLVTLVRNEGRAVARAHDTDVLLTDGPPGIGCPAGAALAGSTHVLLVTEPTRSGLHDLRRIAELCAQSRIPTAVCLNKADLDDPLSEQLLVEAATRDLPVLGRVRYDPAIPAAHRAGSTVIDHAPDSPAAEDLRHLWSAVTDWVSAPSGTAPDGELPRTDSASRPE